MRLPWKTRTTSMPWVLCLGYAPAPASAMPYFSTDITEAHRQKYNGSCLIIPRGTQYKSLLPKITMPCNHRGPLLDLHSGKPFPMVPVGDFNLKDKIFPGTPGDSLLFNSDELVELQRKRYQILTYREEKPPDSSSRKEKQSSSHSSGDAPSSTSKEGESSKSSEKSPQAPSPKVSTDSPGRKPSHHGKCSPPSKEQRDKCEKGLHSLSLKCKDKPCSDRSSKDKEGVKSLWKCPMSLPQRPP